MRTLFLISIFLLVNHFSCLAQYRWQELENFSKDNDQFPPLVWAYKGSEYIMSKNPEKFKGDIDSQISLFVITSERKPSYRQDAGQWVTDEKLWLFGGISEDRFQLMQDLWVYDLTSNRWEMIDNEVLPSPRRGSATWTDNKGRLWLFGGVTINHKDNSETLSNELWSFDIKAQKWTLHEVKESPTPRTDMAVWAVENNKVLLYGGFGYTIDNNRFGGLSDLWELNIERIQWGRLSSEKDSPYDKDLGISSHPGYRIRPVFWKDQEGYCWLMSGQSQVDMHKISIDSYLWKLNPKDYTWTYEPVEPEKFVIRASSIYQHEDRNTYMLFPTYVNEKGEYILSLSTHRLFLRK